MRRMGRRFWMIVAVCELGIVATGVLLITDNPLAAASALLVGSLGFLALCIDVSRLGR